jgi:hypothetical protein
VIWGADRNLLLASRVEVNIEPRSGLICSDVADLDQISMMTQVWLWIVILILVPITRLLIVALVKLISRVMANGKFGLLANNGYPYI